MTFKAGDIVVRNPSGGFRTLWDRLCRELSLDPNAPMKVEKYEPHVLKLKGFESSWDPSKFTRYKPEGYNLNDYL